VVERFETQLGNPELVQPGSGSVILGPLSGQPQLFGQYGGALHFGPDGMLYVAVGDRTIDANGQLLTNDFGKLLRMASDGTIPPSNPFAASAIWALGLRVPWRFSFDRASGDIFIADVGNASWEEIDRLPAGVSGANFGWPTTEGPFNAANHPNFTPPFRAIAHPSTPAGFALIGGFVYRGCAIPSRVGRYFFTEFYSARLSSIAASGSPPGITTESCAPPTGQSLDSPCAFGEDNQGELYICDLDGELYKLVPGDFVDCNGNFVDDRCDVSLGTSHDIDGDGVPDECQACPVAATYGTASASSGGCSAAISFSGSPSASLATPFAIDVTSAEANQHGMVLYGIHGPQSVPWHGGAILCIHPPLQRTPLQDAGGTSGQCDGHFTLDWNAFLSSHPTALGFPWHAGQALWAQAAMRDPSSPSSIATSNALAISVCP
jgi:hypothetical protein